MDKAEIALSLTMKYLEKKDNDSFLTVKMHYYPEAKDPTEISDAKAIAAIFQDIYENINIS